MLRALLDLLVGQRAERVFDHHRGEIVHAERIALHLCLVQEFLVTITAVGRPAASNLMASCVQHDVHDPQSPIAVTTMSLSAAMAAINAGSASLEKLSLR